MTREVCEHFNPIDLPCAKCQEKRKSEALFLADELEIPLGTVIGSEVHRRAAAELHRLHAECEHHKAWVAHITAENKSLEAQRDALLEALQDLCDEQEGPPLVRRHRQWQAAIDKARAAIKAAEEKNKYE